ncbi:MULTISPECIES: hypothetical protein [Klebsiella]|jgi:hypothetical protein|nr:hypothetical protein [Klebsiella aerogenes]OSQ33619.1 hypothetical protein B8A36_14990 [Escherichia coli]AMH09022.1 hypothetical protein AL511_07670 [Klebsiella aerogenes]AMQ58901.1 hypothetical protein AL497_03805 [Klebsiella aerogenes]ATY04364.1 hypothetical protein AM336_01730 [Klebsiella aerogenes]AVE99023.1 hypothetical protein AM441_10440 [Klebsiella aerogenes]
MMKHKGLFLASLLLLTACDEPGGKRAFMRECTAQGDTALCDCAWEKLVQRYGQDWGNPARTFTSPDFIAYTGQAAAECMAE